MFRKESRRNKIRARIRSRVSGTAQKPRLSVFRSNKFIYAQLIDDVNGKTLVSTSSRALTEISPKVDSSALVGKALAEKAVASGISEVVFDRGGYLYHGRVKALADGAREGGLKF
ncbi:MAG: 50S ribosomal protein L18 [Bacteroidia bacterium]|nr:50S ribosomal protein L18 [Bacteroidia bacterium]MCF8427804.1 50S ribosomal protein L18 [Bacteroidia bacterium]MCF8446042.1 50S ribosomal protein L18 [Bacteroidia bacterium]